MPFLWRFQLTAIKQKQKKMDPSYLNALNQGIQSIGGALATGAQSKKAIETAGKVQQKLWKVQNKMNIENWQMQNEYNSDVSQVARRRAAGLNPVTVDGTSNAGTIAGPTASSPGVPVVPDYMRISDQMLASRQLDMQNKLLDSQANVNNAQADSLRGETSPSQADVDLKKSSAALNRATQNLTDSRVVGQRISNQLSDIDRRIRAIDERFAQQNLEVSESRINVETPSGKSFNMPYYLADTIIKGAQVGIEMENRLSSRYNRQSARARAGIAQNEFVNWLESFRNSMEAVRSQIRKNNSSARADEIENDINESVIEAIRNSRFHRNAYEANLYKHMHGEERLGLGSLGRIVGYISPFKGLAL